LKQHTYNVHIEWTGNTGNGTAGYRSYSRDHIISAPGKSEQILAASDPAFQGDPKRYNPEELFVSSLSSCHMLWYLHLCSVNGIVVVAYTDEAHGTMEESADGGGRFTEVTLFPQVTITDADKLDLARSLHAEAHRKCYLANSCNFPVRHEPVVLSR